MRVVVAFVSALCLAAVCEPAGAQHPAGFQLSSLMPMPKLAQYPYPATGVTRLPTYGSPAPALHTDHYQPAASAYRATPHMYEHANTRWSTPRYRPLTTTPQPNYYNYANYSAAAQPQVPPAPSPNGDSGTVNGSNPYLDAMSAPWGSCEGGDAQSHAADCGSAYQGSYFAPCCCERWCVGAAVLFLERVNDNAVWFSFDTADDRGQMMKNDYEWATGFQLNVARTFCCGRFALQGVYWGLFPDTLETNLHRGQMLNALNSVYDFDPLVVDHPGPPPAPIAVNDYFDGARRHRLRRNWDVHNFEINLMGGPLVGYGIDDWATGYASRTCGGNYGAGCYGASCCGAGGWCGTCCGPRLNLGWLFGVRYLHFDDTLQFAGDQRNHTFDYDLDELYYDIDVDNHLIGVQLGFAGDWLVTQRLHLRGGTKFGLFGNHINHKSQIHGAMGNAYVSAGPNAGLEFNVHSKEDDMAFLGEVDLALALHVTPRLVGTLGYRIVAISGVAVADQQIPRHFAGIQDVVDIDTKGNLVLHGAYAGMEFCW
jgi:hypothetical protein